MILLFDSKTSKSSKSSATAKNSNVKSHPVENAGILAMSLNEAKSTLTMGEYDTYVSSSPVTVNYAAYSDGVDSGVSEASGFMGEFSSAVATLGEGGFSAGSFDCGGSYSGSSCSSFSSVG